MVDVFIECIRVSLKLVSQLSHEWIWGIISLRGKWKLSLTPSEYPFSHVLPHNRIDFVFVFFFFCFIHNPLLLIRHTNHGSYWEYGSPSNAVPYAAALTLLRRHCWWSEGLVIVRSRASLRSQKRPNLPKIHDEYRYLNGLFRTAGKLLWREWRAHWLSLILIVRSTHYHIQHNPLTLGLLYFNLIGAYHPFVWWWDLVWLFVLSPQS